MDRRRYLRALGVGSAFGLAGCAKHATEAHQSGDSPRRDLDGTATLTLATATTAYDTGLLDALHPAFERRFGVRVKTLVRGTGASLRTAADGDADVVLVHARDAEDEFLREGFGVNRRNVMYNDFLVVGPADDPAGIGTTRDPREAFRRIARTEATFLSRGDDSGTNLKERELWDAAAVDPSGRWYLEAGDGMGDALVAAGQRGAYTLSDRGTFRAMRDTVDLDALVEGPLGGGPAILQNPYGVIPTNPARHDVNYPEAMAYVGFLTGREGQRRIDEYGGESAGDGPLFVPNALSGNPAFGQYAPED
ncbi:substrate-binding domain-containing protein [Halegenticoccus tardaugens]|uniref:substrate-binding domain-containing protein n=1 Tax=Halegenticoccus tardaugens TaxID=2071624 RepID=UPI00100B6BEA|nr:substrate-binding domain-containing protein [Halegenticoccus tardaugens]